MSNVPWPGQENPGNDAGFGASNPMWKNLMKKKKAGGTPSPLDAHGIPTVGSFTGPSGNLGGAKGLGTHKSRKSLLQRGGLAMQRAGNTRAGLATQGAGRRCGDHLFGTEPVERRRRMLRAGAGMFAAVAIAATCAATLLGGTSAPDVPVQLTTRVAVPEASWNFSVSDITGAVYGASNQDLAALGGTGGAGGGGAGGSSKVSDGARVSDLGVVVMQTSSVAVVYNSTLVGSEALRRAVAAISCARRVFPALDANHTRSNFTAPCDVTGEVNGDGGASGPAAVTLTVNRVLAPDRNAATVYFPVTSAAAVAEAAGVGAVTGAVMFITPHEVRGVALVVRQTLTVAGSFASTDGQKARAASDAVATTIINTLGTALAIDPKDLTHETVASVVGTATEACPAGQYLGNTVVHTELGSSNITACAPCIRGQDGACADECHTRIAFEISLKQAAGFPQSLAVAAPTAARPALLPGGAPLLVLQAVAADCSSTAEVARSYDGRAWEGVMPAPVYPDCSRGGAGQCFVTSTPADGALYRVDGVDVPKPAPKATVARLLTQTTFGPSRASIAAFEEQFGGAGGDDAATAAAWVKAQMALPPTLLRHYYRARAGARQTADTQTGRVTTACDVHSRWHRYAFNQEDKYATVVVSQEKPGVWTLRINGALRNEPKVWNGVAAPSPVNASFVPQTLQMCRVAEELYNPAPSGVPRDPSANHRNGRLQMTARASCNGNSGNMWYWWEPNPALNFVSLDPETTHDFSDGAATFATLPHLPDVLLVERLYKKCPPPSQPDLAVSGLVFMKANDGRYYKFDPRVKLVDNTLLSPVDVQVASSVPNSCPAAQKSFLNQAGCVQRASCSPPTYTTKPIALDDENIKKWYKLSGRHVHWMSGLQLTTPYDDDHPCKGRSRWLKRGPGSCAAPTALAAATLKTLADALAASLDTNNPFVRDITDPAGECDDKTTVGAVVTAAGACWEHVHIDSHNVYDMTYWTIRHDGNEAALRARRPSPIKKFAESGMAMFVFPSSSHDMIRWQSRKKHLDLLGRHGDTVSFTALPTSAQTKEMATLVGALSAAPTDGAEACGSPAEVANEPALGYQFMLPHEGFDFNGAGSYEALDQPHDRNEGKSNVWASVAFNATDQLRQRVAWALSQVCVLSNSGLNRQDEIEPWTIFYDIFVRHAFGNYGDVLREVTYHPVMGEYLTHLRNRAHAYAGAFPDENYAREIMQLFSIGLVKMRTDGTSVRDTRMGTGEEIQTYSNEDIQTMAKVWTGFDNRPKRGNTATPHGEGTNNAYDPMMLKPAWRDHFPKTALNNGYIGDKYPVCQETPEAHFLQQGERYVLTGAASREGRNVDTHSYAWEDRYGRFTPRNATSQLYKRLCARASAAAGGRCTFPSAVVLDATLPCDAGTVECSAQRVRSVKVVDGDKTKYYEYVPRPCVRMTFSANRFFTKSINTNQHQCADPTKPVGTPACCDRSGTRMQISPDEKKGWCLWAQEHTTMFEAARRCASFGFTLCEKPAKWSSTDQIRYACGRGVYAWTPVPCKLQVQINSLNGWVNIVEPVPVGGTPYKPLTLNSNDGFKVRWNMHAGQNEKTEHPLWKSGCDGAATGCTRAPDETCLCNVTVSTEAPFVDPSFVPSAAELRRTLFIGSHEPRYFSAGGPDHRYVQCVAPACINAVMAGVRVWNRYNETRYDGNATINGGVWHDLNDGRRLVFRNDTIFEVDPTADGSLGDGASRKLFLRNAVETVRVGGGGRYSFRNPPNFMPLLGERAYQFSEYGADMGEEASRNEIEATFEHLMEHENTAPFVAKRLMQRLVTSNPSPRYVEAAATAFRTGRYGGVTYSGRNGDLAALTAAILLDREARSSTLDYDITHGALREPLLKVMHFLRAMEYKPYEGRQIAFATMQSKLGQSPFGSPSVFNYYLAEYEPTGPLEKAKLVSPEAELSTAPLIVNFMNGMSSLVDNGLTNCVNGFGSGQAKPSRKCTSWGYSGSRHPNAINMQATSDGNLTFAPSSSIVAEIVSELNLVLADGRMSAYARKIIGEQYNLTYATTPVSNRSDTSTVCGRRWATKCGGYPAASQFCDDEYDGRCRAKLADTQRRRRRRVAPLERPAGADAWDFAPDSEETHAVRSAAALRAAQKMAMVSAAFHMTNADVDTGAVLRPMPPKQESKGRPFKAVVVVFLAGAADSYNLLVPHTCAPVDLHAEYLEARTNVAIPKSRLLAVDPGAAAGQPCSTFGLHPNLKNIQAMYNAGDALAVANIGNLVVPLTPDEYKKNSKPRPPGLFAHNVQQRGMHSLHPQLVSAKGVLGRMLDALTQRVDAFSSKVFSLVGNIKIVEGSIAPVIVSASSGIPQYAEFNKYKTTLLKLTNPLSSSLFADTHKDRVASAFNTTQAVGAMLADTTLETAFGADSFGKQMAQVAKLIKLRKEEGLEMERAAFITNQGGFDTHTDVGTKLEEIMTYVDDGVGAFKAEMEKQGLWDSVTLLTVSDFGRTLTSNGQGTDHAWAGHHFMMGGDLKGGAVHGKYPASLKSTHELNIGRGRLLPTTPWEGMWKGVAEWFGVEPAQMKTVLPNAENFPGLLGKDEMYHNKATAT